MKKNKLIELLQKIEGNPDIYLWNGFVGDWVDIDPKFVEQMLVKETLDHTLACLERQWCRDYKTFEIPEDVKANLKLVAKRHYKAQYWDFPNSYLEYEKYPDWYGNKRKKIVIINAKEKGKTTWDRLGSMSY